MRLVRRGDDLSRHGRVSLSQAKWRGALACRPNRCIDCRAS